MSFNVEGIVLRGEKPEVVDSFSNLSPSIPLRLISIVEEEVWGICSDPTNGWRPELVEIAKALSVPFGKALYYGYFSVAGEYGCQLFQDGRLTHEQHHDPERNNWDFAGNVEPLGLAADINWDRELESLFRSGSDNAVLEH